MIFGDNRRRGYVYNSAKTVLNHFCAVVATVCVVALLYALATQ
jgi:hypothetical protein